MSISKKSPIRRSLHPSPVTHSGPNRTGVSDIRARANRGLEAVPFKLRAAHAYQRAPSGAPSGVLRPEVPYHAIATSPAFPAATQGIAAVSEAGGLMRSGLLQCSPRSVDLL